MAFSQKSYIVVIFNLFYTAAAERLSAIEILSSQKMQMGWGLGAALGKHMSNQATTPGLVRLYQLLLFTLPGTPVFNYGDEIGLQAEVRQHSMHFYACTHASLNLIAFPHFLLL